jgi:cobalt-zinc-cadmium efflux system membrane fusion protein
VTASFFSTGDSASRITLGAGYIAMIRTGILVAGLLLGAASSSMAQVEHHDEASIKLSLQQIEAGAFAVQDVRSGEIGRRIAVPGAIVPSGNHIARVAVRLLGTVAELRKQIGDVVSAGDVLAVIESREVADAKSEYLAARLVSDLQHTLFNRAKTLWDGRVMSENEFLRARTSFEDARVKLEVARQKLFALSLNAEQIETLPNQPVETLRRQEVRAPISGRVAERRVELGSLVGREGQESELFVIVDLATVWAEMAVAPNDLNDIREGQRITIASGQSAPSPATIMFISPLLDKDTRNARVVAVVDNVDRKWRPGAFITAEIPVDQSAAAITVPKTALQTLERDTVVFVRSDDGFEPRKVTLGRQDRRVAEVTSGLKPGERIATSNTFVLKADLGKAAVEHAH